MTLFLIILVIWVGYGIAAYHLGKSTGYNEMVDDLTPALDDLYDRAFDTGSKKGYDDGRDGLDGAVAAVKAWGEECRQD